MSKEYIEKSAASEIASVFFTMSMCIDERECRAMNNAARIIESQIDSITAADVVEVVHAHWVKPTKIGWRSVDVPHCSHCKEIPCGVDMNTHYCPNCGAKMDKEDDET